MTSNSLAFAVRFSNINTFWEVRSVRISLTNRSFWKTVPLGSVCKVRSDIVPSSQLETGKVKMLDRISFDEGKVHFGNRTQTKMTQYRAMSGDIVVSKINARKRAIGIVPNETEVGLTIHFRALTADKSQADTQFLWLALRSDFCKNQFDVETGGMGKGEISEERLLSIKAPLPPLNTQRAVVSRWHSAQHFAAQAKDKIIETEKAIEKKFFADLGLKLPSHSQNPKAFAAHWKDFERWSVSYNQAILTSVDISRGKYAVTEFRDILSMVQYGTSEKANEKGLGVPVLRINNVKKGGLDLSDLKHIPLQEKTRENLLIKDGDILIIRTSGSRDLVGTCAVFHETQKYVFASYLIRLRVDSAKANPDYVAWLINSRIGRQQIDALSRQIMQNNINSQELRSLKLPLPPLKAQQEIIAHVESGRAEIARQKQLAEKIRKDSEAEIEALILGTKKI